MLKCRKPVPRCIICDEPPPTPPRPEHYRALNRWRVCHRCAIVAPEGIRWPCELELDHYTKWRENNSDAFKLIDYPFERRYERSYFTRNSNMLVYSNSYPLHSVVIYNHHVRAHRNQAPLRSIANHDRDCEHVLCLVVGNTEGGPYLYLKPFALERSQTKEWHRLPEEQPLIAVPPQTVNRIRMHEPLVIPWSFATHQYTPRAVRRAARTLFSIRALEHNNWVAALPPELLEIILSFM